MQSSLSTFSYMNVLLVSGLRTLCLVPSLLSLPLLLPFCQCLDFELPSPQNYKKEISVVLVTQFVIFLL